MCLVACFVPAVAAAQTTTTPQPPSASPNTTGGVSPTDPQFQPAPKARIVNGIAIPPIGAPQEVVDAINAANQIVTKPYIFGGGHRSFHSRGYDCSGSVSFALHGAGLLDTPLASGDMESWGDPGPGQWVTIYANGGHAYMVVAGLRFDTSGATATGSRWQTDMRSSRGYVGRHPDGL